MIYFTSDLHFGHKNVIQFCNRPFTSVSDMNEKLIENWNMSVNKEDTIYVVGDFSFAKKQETEVIFKRLNGRKILVKGNHDGGNTLMLPWAEVHDSTFLNSPYISMSHFPKKSWNRSYHGSYHIFGHVHGSGNYWADGLSCDVGVDMWNYKPVSLTTLCEFFNELNIVQAKYGYFMWRGKPFDKLDVVSYNDLEKIKQEFKKGE